MDELTAHQVAKQETAQSMMYVLKQHIKEQELKNLHNGNLLFREEEEE